MWRVSVVTMLAVLCIGSSVQAERRVKLGENMNRHMFSVDEIADSYDLKVHAIQEDQKLPGNILAAIGSAVYTINEFGTFTLLAGSPGTPGYRRGWHSTVRFNETAGIAQTSSNTLIVADKNNQCLRKIDRTTNEVETFAGTCNTNQIYTEANYTLWETFNSPTTLHYDSSRNYLYVLDVMEAGLNSVIIYNNVRYPGSSDRGKITTSTRAGYLYTDFFYDSSASTFFIARGNEITTVEWKYNSLREGSNIFMSGVHGVASHDDIVVGSYVDEGYVTINDQRTADVFNLCGASEWYIVDCTLNKPTAVAIINSKLYVGTTEVTNTWTGLREVKAYINFIEFSTTSEQTTTTIWNYRNENTTADDFVSGTNGGTIAIIVLACICGIGLKVGLITWRVRRWTYRFNGRRGYGRTTIVAVTSTTTAVPYGRLQEPEIPTGQFPTPPPYTPSPQMQPSPAAAPGGQQMQSGNLQAPPAVHYPPPAPASRRY